MLIEPVKAKTQVVINGSTHTDNAGRPIYNMFI